MRPLEPVRKQRYRIIPVLSTARRLQAYTTGSSCAEFQEGQKGQIAPGMLADLALLSDDIFSIEPARLRDVSVRLTMVGGKTVYGK